MLDLVALTVGLSPVWAGLLRDWDRSLRAANYPVTTRYVYVLAAVQLGRFLAAQPPEAAMGRAVADPAAVTRGQVEDFQVWMIETRSAATAVNQYKGLQQFFRWLVEEEVLDASPMLRLRRPRAPVRLVPVLDDAQTHRILQVCQGRGFAQVRDEAIIRLLCNTGARLGEVAGLGVEDIDLDRDRVRLCGKGAEERQVRFGAKTGRALRRYVRSRAQHPGAGLAALWLGERGARGLSANGIKLMLRRRGRQAGVDGVHAHRWRHSFAHGWKLVGGDGGDLMLLMGWRSEEMLRRYGASAAAERARTVAARLGIGERV